MIYHLNLYKHTLYWKDFKSNYMTNVKILTHCNSALAHRIMAWTNLKLHMKMLTYIYLTICTLWLLRKKFPTYILCWTLNPNCSPALAFDRGGGLTWNPQCLSNVILSNFNDDSWSYNIFLNTSPNFDYFFNHLPLKKDMAFHFSKLESP